MTKIKKELHCLTAKDRILCDEINNTRADLIRAEFESEFLRAFMAKLQDEEVKIVYDGCYDLQSIRSRKRQFDDECVYFKERLSFFKSMKKSMDENIFAKYVEEIKGTPESVNPYDIIEESIKSAFKDYDTFREKIDLDTMKKVEYVPYAEKEAE